MIDAPIYEQVSREFKDARAYGELLGRLDERSKIKTALAEILAGRSVKKDLNDLIKQLERDN